MYFIAIWVSYLLFILLAIFVFAASFHSWSVEKKKKAKTQEGSLRNSVNFCTIPVALSFCKMCCLTCASLVVFVLYHDIDRAVYAPVTLSSFFFFFPGMSVQGCACVFTLFLGCCLFKCNLFFCLNVQLTNGRLYFNASLGWSFCPRYWAGATEWLEHVVLLLYATCCCFLFFYRRQWTLHWRFHRFLLVAQSVGVSRVFAFTFAVQICTVGACFFFFNSGAAILWLQLFFFFLRTCH